MSSDAAQRQQHRTALRAALILSVRERRPSIAMRERWAKPTLAILRTHFCKGKDGRWEIETLKSIPLGPRSRSGDANFFAIEDDLVVESPALARTIKLVLGHSIAPIVAHASGSHQLATPAERTGRSEKYWAPMWHRQASL